MQNSALAVVLVSPQQSFSRIVQTLIISSHLGEVNRRGSSFIFARGAFSNGTQLHRKRPCCFLETSGLKERERRIMTKPNTEDFGLNKSGGNEYIKHWFIS